MKLPSLRSVPALGPGGKPQYLPLGEIGRTQGDDAEAAFQGQGAAPRKPASRRTSLFACCAICSLAVLAVLFALNSAVVRSHVLRAEASAGSRTNLDSVLDDWGRPGSGTEDIARYPTDFLRNVMPVPCHSHNDYWRRVPLFSAIFAGCTGVEADVWLHENELYVGHDPAALQPKRTFSSLYVDPLVEILERQNPSTRFYNGSDRGVFDASPYESLTLLVDLKTLGQDTWQAVLDRLEPLRTKGWLTHFKDGKVRRGPVTVVGTGFTLFSQVTADANHRDVFFDAPLDKLDGGDYDSTNSYYASVSLSRAIGEIERGQLSPEQLAKIRSHVKAAHDRGLKARYWDLPSWPVGFRNHVWESLVREGVDILNVDDLAAATTQNWAGATAPSPGPP